MSKVESRCSLFFSDLGILRARCFFVRCWAKCCQTRRDEKGGFSAGSRPTVNSHYRSSNATFRHQQILPWKVKSCSSVLRLPINWKSLQGLWSAKMAFIPISQKWKIHTRYLATLRPRITSLQPDAISSASNILFYHSPTILKVKINSNTRERAKSTFCGAKNPLQLPHLK